MFFISGCDHFVIQGVPCCSLPSVPMFLCGIMRFHVNKPHEAMEESLVIRRFNGHTGQLVSRLCFKCIRYASELRDKSFDRSSKEGRIRVLLGTRPRPGRCTTDLTVVAQLVVPTTGSLFKATDVDAISNRRAVASRAIRSSCPRLA